MDRHYFNPTPDTIYTNKGGGSYICLEAEGHFRAKFQRVSKYKWTGEPPEPIYPTFSANESLLYEQKVFRVFKLSGGSRLSDVRGRHNRVGQLHRRILRGMIPHKWDFKSHISSKEIAKYETELYRQKSFFRYNR